MRIITEEKLGAVLAGIPGTPRVVADGNFATPWRALGLLDAAIGEYRLYMLNAQPGIPDRPGVTLETSFVGAGMRVVTGRADHQPGGASVGPRRTARHRAAPGLPADLTAQAPAGYGRSTRRATAWPLATSSMASLISARCRSS